MSDVPQPYDPYQQDPYQRGPHPGQQYGAEGYYGPPGRPISKVTRLQYLYAFQYIFESTNWFLSLLMGSLAWLSTQVIPIIGPLVFMGYQYEVMDHLHRNRTMPYPDFDFNRFGDYLARGVWPFFIGFFFAILMSVLAWIFLIVGSLLIPISLAMVQQSGASDAVFFLTAILLVMFMAGIFLTIYTFLSFLTGPMSLAGGLSGEFTQAFNFRFIFDFMHKMWLEMCLAYLWLAVVGGLVVLIGVAFLCIGVYPAMAWNHMAATHINWQLYELYLDRGGMRIPLKEMRY